MHNHFERSSSPGFGALVSREDEMDTEFDPMSFSNFHLDTQYNGQGSKTPSYQDLMIDTGAMDELSEMEFENLTIDELCSNDILNGKPGV
jgi:hypothetical protein